MMFEYKLFAHLLDSFHLAKFPCNETLQKLGLPMFCKLLSHGSEGGKLLTKDSILSVVILLSGVASNLDTPQHTSLQYMQVKQR